MHRWLVPLLYFYSSMAALVYELTWMRMLGGVVGVAFVATAIVLAAHMGGLGIGSALAGRWSPQRPLLTFAFFELALAGWTRVLPYGLVSGNEALSVALVVLPSTLVGASYPLLVSALASPAEPSAAGRLYVVGTLGGVAGVLIGGLWWLPQLGVPGTAAAAAAIGGAVALLALWLTRRRAETPAPRRAEHLASTDRLAERRAMVIVALSGGATMVYELVWFRALRWITLDTTRSVSCVLAAFLLGIALGAQLANRAGPSRPLLWVGWAQITVAIYALLSPHLLRTLDAAALRMQPGASLLEPFGISLLILLLPATLLGATFPLCLRIYGGRGTRKPRMAATIYAASTFGAIGGVVGGGLLVAWIGARGAVMVGAAANASAAWVAIRARANHATRWDAWLRWSHAPTAFVAATLLLWRGEVFFQAPAGVLVVRAEDASGVVHVVRNARGTLSLYANRSHRWGSDAPAMVAGMKRQGELPLVLHPNPSRLIEIGLGTGVQLQPAVADDRVGRIDVVELSPAIVTGAGHFAASNGGLLSHPKTQLTIADGRHFLETATAQWDVIVLGLFTPYRPGAGQLFSHELYDACRQRLAPGGILVHWLPLAQLSPAALRSVVRTFIAVFPEEAHAWQRAQYLALVAAADMPVRLARIRPDAVVSWLSGYTMGPAALARWTEGAQQNTQAHPVVELDRPEPGVTAMLANMRNLLDLREPPLVTLPATLAATAVTAHQARGHALRSVIAQARGDAVLARTELRRAAALYPDDEIVRAQRER